MNRWMLVAAAVIILCSGCAEKNGEAQVDNGIDSESAIKKCIGIIRENRETEYVVNLCSDTKYPMIVDKCGTDFAEGTDVIIEYSGSVIHYDGSMNVKDRQDFNYAIFDGDRYLTDDDIILKAEEYKSVSEYNNDYTFYGTVGPITNLIRDGDKENINESLENGAAGTDCEIIYYPDSTEDEYMTQEIFGDIFGFCGYSSEMNDNFTDSEGHIIQIITVGDRVKVTYNSDTMHVTAVELIESYE